MVTDTLARRSATAFGVDPLVGGVPVVSLVTSLNHRLSAVTPPESKKLATTVNFQVVVCDGAEVELLNADVQGTHGVLLANDSLYSPLFSTVKSHLHCYG